MRQNGEQQTPPTTDVNHLINTPLLVFFGDSNNVQNTVTYPPEIAESWDRTLYESMFGNGFDGNFASLDGTANKAYIPPVDYQSEMASFSNFSVAASPAGAFSSSGRQETAINSSTPASLGDAGTSQDPMFEVDRGISESDTQRLAKINLDSVNHVGQIGRGSPEISLNTLVTLIDTSDDFSGTPIHSILRSSRELVDVICGLSNANKKANPGAVAWFLPEDAGIKI
ncbi:uncharacterized protein F4812DRAFT_456156 [Daldinia caldariorum]|uniref:uncharacterized protein n=1 Tax=Daldinia caldariorum TaxID=326644 RepID=UPI0020072DC0|nr:uncharacterized protein F4812DRAFT_456156 [Daldinia caldariorum]KAI1472059.1 hypothetical protein F4812DRAFT_456156 [Daldinia caldariorum]